MISVGLIGGSGYVGKHLLHLLFQHPHIKELSIYALISAGKSLYSVFPGFLGLFPNLEIQSVDNLQTHDVYFVSLPHGEAISVVAQLVQQGKVVIDLGGDFRLNSAKDYEHWYQQPHTAPDLLTQKTYGLAEWTSLHNYTNLISNPGCYPTAIGLALQPLFPALATNVLAISVNAYSGTSGAGKSPNSDLLLSEMDGNVRAYNIHRHRHEPEILQELTKKGFEASFTFTPHLLPTAVGIYATSVVHGKDSFELGCIQHLFASAYQTKPFIRLRENPPHLSWVVGTNFCDIHISVRENTIIITSTIDNLIKGAAGQAVQHLNQFYGWKETTGILKESHYVSVFG